MFKFLVLFFCFICVTHSGVAPFITKCKAEDTKCLKSSAQAVIPIFAQGIQEYGIEKFDPLTIPHLDASSKVLKLILKDVTARGLKDSVVKKLRRDKANSKISISILCSADLEGQYELNGQLLFISIQGKGKAHVVLRKMLISAEAELGEVIGDDGLKHWTVKNWKHSYELKDHSTVELENLFNGNEVLAQAAQQLISSSGNEIIVEVGPPIIKAVVAKIIENVEKLFKNVPASELEL